MRLGNATHSTRLGIYRIPRLRRRASSPPYRDHCGSREQGAEVLVAHLIPVIREAGKSAALVARFEAKPTLAVVPEVILGGGLGMDGRAENRPHSPLHALLVDKIADCH